MGTDNMAMDLKYLLQKYLTSSLTGEEELAFKKILHDEQHQEELEKAIDEYALHGTLQLPVNESLLQASFERLKTSLHPVEQNTTAIPIPMQGESSRFSWLKYAAAVLLLMISAAVYLTFLQDDKNRELVGAKNTNPPENIIPPGGDRALLTLADGRKIILDSAANGTLASEGNAQVIKLADGKIVYNVQGATNEPVWNTMSTPAGGQYQVTLPDGTKVWLNSSTSITYPTLFTGKKREVKISGEVYMEVAANKQQPFIVNVNGQTVIEVLGTKFNVNAYANEPSVRTALVEGSVRVTKGSPADLAVTGGALPSAILKPGDEASVALAAESPEKDIKIISGIDVDQVLAWKNGLFNFNGLRLRSVMRQLERWYDIQVKYESSVPDIVFKGKMYRNIQLSDVLEVLREMGLQFQIKDRVLTITSARQ